MNERIWRKLYRATLSERDLEKLRDRIYETEAAIFLRLQTLEKGSVSEAEQNEIEQATAAILRLKVEQLHFPQLSTKH